MTDDRHNDLREALGVLGVHVIDAEGDALHAKRTTQGAFHWVHTWHHRGFDAFLEAVRRRDMTIAAACMDADTLLHELPADRPVCLLLGNEQRGLSERAKRAADILYRIPMVGMSESLNLSVSAAISLYDVVRRRRAHIGKPGDLDEATLERERARCYLHSVDERLIRALLPVSSE